MGNKTTQTQPVSAKRTCWACHRPAGTGHLCRHCSALQPLLHSENHFAVMGLSPRLNLDSSELQRTLYELSRSYHPDFYQTRTQGEKTISENATATINTAFETLRDPIKRIEYLLTLEGLPIEQGNSKPPMDLFEEILGIQEAIGEYREAKLSGAAAPKAVQVTVLKAKEDLEARLAALRKNLEALSQRWDARLDSSPIAHGSDPEEKKKILTELRESLSAIAYLRTVLRDIDNTLKGSG